MHLAPILRERNDSRLFNFPMEDGYLIRSRKPRVAHIWTGVDTCCRMASTGGLNLRKYEFTTRTDLPICTMCRP